MTPVGIRQPCHHKVQLLGVACIYWQLKTDVKETKSEWSGMPYSWFNLMCRIAAKFCLPPPSAGLGWPGLGLTRPRGIMAASQPLPEPMPIDTFSPSFNFCQKSLIQFLKFYNRSHSVLNFKVSLDYCSQNFAYQPPSAGLCWPWLVLAGLALA